MCHSTPHVQDTLEKPRRRRAARRITSGTTDPEASASPGTPACTHLTEDSSPRTATGTPTTTGTAYAFAIVICLKKKGLKVCFGRPRIDWGPMAGSEDNAHGADGGCAHADWIAAGGSIYHSGDRHVRMPRPVHARRTCNLVPGNIVLTPASLGEGAQGLRVHMQIKLCTVHRGGMHCKTSSRS